MGDLGEELIKYQKQKFCSFHTPGHKGRQEFFYGLDYPDSDLTELPGLDILHSPSGIIAQAQKRSAQIFGAEETYFLINGGTVGNHAMFLALDQSKDKRVVIERSSHRSVMSALVLSGLKPDYIMPTVHPEFNLPLGLDVERQTIKWSEISACHVTYPSYFGTGFDLKRLLDERMLWGPKIPIFVDQAHGSHYLGPLFPPSAVKLGADLVLHSSHKTLSALTQSAMLHVQENRVSRIRLRQSLELLQSSSPSYLLLASLERAAESALDFERWKYLKEQIIKLHHELDGELRILSCRDIGTYGIHTVDWSKVLVNTLSLGLSAPCCVNYLRERFKIEPELWDDENILFMLGIGNTVEDIQQLRKALKGLVHFSFSVKDRKFAEQRNKFNLKNFSFPKVILSPREAFFAPKRQIPLKESLGHIVGETISPYPPGIPIIVMGEKMTSDVLEILLRGKDGRWQGWDGFKNQTIWVIDKG